MFSLSTSQVDLLLCRPKQKRENADGVRSRRWKCGCFALERFGQMELVACEYHAELFGAVTPPVTDSAALKSSYNAAIRRD